jgi:hypothetical protein
MHKNKTIKRRKNKHSKKTSRRNVCERGVTDEVIRTRKLIKELRELRLKNKKRTKKSRRN